MINQGSDDWHMKRMYRISASQFGAIMGISPFQKPEELLLQSLLPQQRDLANKRAETPMQWGIEHEEEARQTYAAQEGVEVDKAGFYTHPKYDWIGASPDGFVGSDGLLEIKCPYTKKLHTEVPAHYMAQIQGQLEVLDRDWCDYFCWTPEATKTIRVMRDRAYWDAMFPKLEQFWHQKQHFFARLADAQTDPPGSEAKLDKISSIVRQLRPEEAITSGKGCSFIEV